MALAACGGGGGDDEVTAGSPSNGNGTTPPAATGDVNPGLTGTIYYRPPATYRFQRVDARSGVQADTAGIDNYLHDITFSKDGTRYAYTYWDTVTGYENSDYVSVTIYETATDKKLSTFEFDGYATAFKFSPDNRYLSMKQYPDLVASHTGSSSGLRIVDLADPARPVVVVNHLRSGGTRVVAHDWLPGNRYVALRSDGQLLQGDPTLGSAGDTPNGTLTNPNGLYRINWMQASPDGKKLLLMFGWEDGASFSDIWVANVDGTGVERVTNAIAAADAQWTPDGQHLLISTNAGLFYNANYHNGYCIRWYVAASARNVSEHSAESRHLNVINKYGGEALLSCSAAIQVGR